MIDAANVSTKEHLERAAKAFTQAQAHLKDAVLELSSQRQVTANVLTNITGVLRYAESGAAASAMMAKDPADHYVFYGLAAVPRGDWATSIENVP